MMTNERQNFIIKDVYVQITEINIKMKMIRRRYSNKTPLILHWSESSDSCRVCYVTYRFYCPCFAKSTDCRIKQSKGIFFLQRSISETPTDCMLRSRWSNTQIQSSTLFGAVILYNTTKLT